MRLLSFKKANDNKEAMEFAYAMGLKDPKKKVNGIRTAKDFAQAMGLKNPFDIIFDLFDDNQDDNMRPRFAV